MLIYLLTNSVALFSDLVIWAYTESFLIKNTSKELSNHTIPSYFYYVHTPSRRSIRFMGIFDPFQRWYSKWSLFSLQLRRYSSASFITLLHNLHIIFPPYSKLYQNMVYLGSFSPEKHMKSGQGLLIHIFYINYKSL